MDLGLSGRGALVVGGGANIGRAAAIALAHEGARVVVAGRQESSLSETVRLIEASGGEASVEVVDARDSDSVARLVAGASVRLGAIDILVNTVGPFPGKPADADPIYGGDESWAVAFDTVFMASVRVCREVVPLMKAAGRGAVVNVGANSARYYNPMTAQYGAMKSALTHVTKNLARDAAESGVRVNAVLPGFVKTDSMERWLHSQESVDPLDVERQMVMGHDKIYWTGRMGTVQEYADVITFLVSERAGYVNGALVPVDGGSPVW